MKVFYDATQLVHWEGMLTGIPRVMNELAIRFHNDPEIEVYFTSWVGRMKQMYHVDFNRSIMQRGNGILYLEELGESVSPNENSEVNIPDSRERTLKSSSKNSARKVAKRGFSALRRYSPSTAQRIEKRVDVKRMARKLVAQPESGDAIFIPWGEWWDQHYIDYLLELQKKGVKLFPIIHDVLPMTNPQFSGHSTDSLSNYCRSILPVSTHVFCVSESTKKETVEWLKSQNCAIPSISAFRLGDDFKVSKSRMPDFTPDQRKLFKSKKFLLSVGTIEARKNHTLLYYIYKLAASKDITLPPIAVVGRRGWKTENIYEIITEDPQVNDKIQFLQGMSDEELSWFYENCAFVVYPSFCEGWGLPIAESAVRGVPCITSNISSMPEVLGDLGIYCNPFSADEYLQKITELLEPDKLKLAADRTKKYTLTTWDDSFKQIKTGILS